MDEKILKIFEESLSRCTATKGFLESFYKRFLASSPKVREKFALTDFVRQRRALRASLHYMLLAAQNEEKDPDKYLKDLAELHSRRVYNVGSELYDLWLDSLLATVKECDPQYTPEVEQAWESVMMVGIHYMLKHY
jgi:hemoglobin-like flavoprotein